VEIKGKMVPMSASIGVAVFPNDGDSVTELLRSADLAMYESKKLARGGVRRYRREVTVEEVEKIAGLGAQAQNA
jgi:GGDEF domain-containing protein